MSESVTLAALHAANKARQTEWCEGGAPEPDLAFRGNELAGETGEACNVIKKLERERHGWRGSRATPDQLAEELADVVICADLCAVTAGIDLGAAVVAKFNATSEKVGLTTRLEPAALASTAGAGAGDWQPIWTAPKDGDPLDLWVKDQNEYGGGYREADARWARPNHTCGEAGHYCDSCPPKGNQWCDNLGRWIEVDDPEEGGRQITHWRRPAGPGQSPAVPDSPRSGAGDDLEQATADQIKAGLEVFQASPSAPVEHGVEIRQAMVVDLACAMLDEGPAGQVPIGVDAASFGRGQRSGWDAAVSEFFRRLSALSQGGGAGRSERAVETRERAGAVFIIIRTTGEYSDRSEDLIAATFDGEAAKRWTEETQKVCQTLAAETNRAFIEEGFEAEQAARAAAKARCPDPTFEPWGGYAEDVQYGIREIKIGLPAPAQSPSTSEEEG
ncbi:MazG-like family protein [Methylobacterium sp. CCH5-D2]|uniref:MazG-like family protein n=1 Tax=Methylobacterium sp. CCH5-D2 TaxID=1768765 RepID=UPI000A9BBBED|nr:MazG-like family protein [Methylobacterium sp. CCH5-D2]